MKTVGQTIAVCGLPICQPNQMFYRRHLPHWYPEDAAIFVTWRLAGSKPPSVCPEASFPERDEQLDHCEEGPLWLHDHRVARVVADAIQYGESALDYYHLRAWVIMPNHVHVIFEPRTQMCTIMRWLKGRTARKA